MPGAGYRSIARAQAFARAKDHAYFHHSLVERQFLHAQQMCGLYKCSCLLRSGCFLILDAAQITALGVGVGHAARWRGTSARPHRRC